MLSFSLFYFDFFPTMNLLILSPVKVWLELWFSGRVPSPALPKKKKKVKIKLLSSITIICGPSDVGRVRLVEAAAGLRRSKDERGHPRLRTNPYSLEIAVNRF